MKRALSSRKIAKICVVVRDVETTAKNYAALLGIPVPKVETYADPPGPLGPDAAIFRGRPARYFCKIATIPFEPVPMELLEPAKDAPSPWGEFLAKHGDGVHFLSIVIDGFEEHIQLMEGLKMPLSYRHDKGDKRYAYFDSARELGVTLELKELGAKRK